MTRTEISEVVQTTAAEYGWDLEKALMQMYLIGFDIDKAANNNKFTESHVKMSVDFAYHASVTR